MPSENTNTTTQTTTTATTTSTPGGQQPAGQPPSGGTPQSAPGASPYSQDQGAQRSAEVDRLRAELEAAQAAARQREEELEAIRAREEEARQAELSEIEKERERNEKLAARLAELEAREEQRRKGDALWQTALEQGVAPTRREALLRLVDLSAITLNKGGDVAGVEAALEQARALAPEFFGGSVTTAAASSGQERPSERQTPGPESDFDRGAEAMRRRKERKGRGQQRGRSTRL